MRATVNIPFDEFEKIQRRERELENKITELEILAARAQRPTEGHLANVYNILDVAMPILRFAIANLPPETSPGWPYKALRNLSTLLLQVPGVTPDLRAVAEDFRARSDEIEPYEVARAARPKRATLATSEDFGPQSEEARQIHEVRGK